jgi:hypothetical protein
VSVGEEVKHLVSWARNEGGAFKAVNHIGCCSCTGESISIIRGIAGEQAQIAMNVRLRVGGVKIPKRSC